MNETVEKFLKKNGISNNREDYQVFSRSNINPILGKYVVPGNQRIEEVSIANILGYGDAHFSSDLTNNICDNLDHFFDAEGSSYQRRSLGMLDYSSDDAIRELKQVSETDYIEVLECETNKYVIGDNGMHRYNILRFHYLNQLAKINREDPVEIRNLNEKFKIKVKIQTCDFTKTYCYYLLKMLVPSIIKLEATYDENYKFTGETSIQTADHETHIFSDEELLVLLKEAIDKKQNTLLSNIDRLQNRYESIQSFREFVDSQNLFSCIKEESLWEM